MLVTYVDPVSTGETVGKYSLFEWGLFFSAIVIALIAVKPMLIEQPAEETQVEETDMTLSVALAHLNFIDLLSKRMVSNLEGHPNNPNN